MTFLFDACALIAFLNQEREGYVVVSALFDRADAGEVTIRMSIVNLVEVYYGYVRDEGMEEADRIMRNVVYLPMEIITTISDEVYRETARLKGTYRPLSLADAFLCGAAKSLGATIVTKDDEIRKPEQPEALSVLWINANPAASPLNPENPSGTGP
ncbi:MAG: type II toxin-antitoxin system VapC family toxin [Treponema sp.]|nr:type II toxin-antitoxin system VapC family toxin [Treponema sp.]